MVRASITKVRASSIEGWSSGGRLANLPADTYGFALQGPLTWHIECRVRLEYSRVKSRAGENSTHPPEVLDETKGDSKNK